MTKCLKRMPLIAVLAMALGTGFAATDALARGGGGGGGGGGGHGGGGGGGGGHMGGGMGGGHIGGHVGGGFGGGRFGGGLGGGHFAGVGHGGHIGGIHGGRPGLRHHFGGVGGYGSWPYDYYDDAYAYGDCYQTRRYHTRTGWHTRQVYVCD